MAQDGEGSTQKKELRKLGNKYIAVISQGKIKVSLRPLVLAMMVQDLGVARGRYARVLSKVLYV